MDKVHYDAQCDQKYFSKMKYIAHFMFSHDCTHIEVWKNA